MPLPRQYQSALARTRDRNPAQRAVDSTAAVLRSIGAQDAVSGVESANRSNARFQTENALADARRDVRQSNIDSVGSTAVGVGNLGLSALAAQDQNKTASLVSSNNKQYIQALDRLRTAMAENPQFIEELYDDGGLQ